MCGEDMGMCAAATPDQQSQSMVEACHPGCSGSSATMSDACSTPLADTGAGTQPSASAAWPSSGLGAHSEPEPATDSVSSSSTTPMPEPTVNSGMTTNSAESGGSAGTQAIGSSAGAGAAPAIPKSAALADGRQAGTAVSDGVGAGTSAPASTAGGSGDLPAAAAEPAAGADRAAQDSSAGARASELQEKLLKQVEFYFSNENLPTDAFLLKQVSRSPEGWGALQAALKYVRGNRLERLCAEPLQLESMYFSNSSLVHFAAALHPSATCKVDMVGCCCPCVLPVFFCHRSGMHWWSTSRPMLRAEL